MPSKSAAATTDRHRRPRGSLSRDEILRGALFILEHEGLDGLSMPALAKQLGAGVTSIYWYFRTKDDLLAAVAENVTNAVAQQLPMIGEGPWDEELVRYFVAYRRIMHTRPVYREVMVYHPAMFRRYVMTATLPQIETALKMLVNTGLSPIQASDSFAACTDFARGFISIEHSRDVEPVETDDTLPSSVLNDYSSLTPAQKIAAIYGLDDQTYEAGIRILVDGIRAEGTRAKSTRRRPVSPSPSTSATFNRALQEPPVPVPPPPKRKTRRPRGSLSREEILTVAEQLIESSGLRALSMPILAKQLGAGVTSIYWYFRSKDDLLVALAERVTARLYEEMPAGDDDEPWDQMLLRFFTAYRAELQRSPVYLELAMIRPRFVFSQPGILPLVTGTIDRQVTSLGRAGLTPLQAARVYQTCSTYTLSFAMLAHGFDDGGYDSEFRAGINRAEFPVFAELANTKGGLSKGERQFQAGIRMLVDGTAAIIEHKAKAPAKGKARAAVTSKRRKA